jgi:hypothetical protein
MGYELQTRKADKGYALKTRKPTTTSERSKFEQRQTTAGPGLAGNEPMLRGWERDWAMADLELAEAFAPSALDPQRAEKSFVRSGFGFSGGLMYPSLKMAKGVAQVSPFGAAAKYIFPSNRDALELMNEEERATMLVHDVLGTALWRMGGVLSRWWKEADMLAAEEKLRGLKPMLAAEDAITRIEGAGGTWRGFDYTKDAQKLARGRGFAKDEIPAVVETMRTGDPLSLKVLAYEKKLQGKKMSDGWNRHTQVSKEAYGGPELSKDLSEIGRSENMAARHYARLYRENAKKQGLNVSHSNELVKSHAKHFFGEEFAKDLDIRHLNMEQTANLITTFYEPTALGKISSWQRIAGDRFFLRWRIPERHVMGAGEEQFKMLTNVYDKVASALMNVNRYRLDTGQLFGKMLAERGLGTVKADKYRRFIFKANKKWNPKTTKAAFDYLSKVDDAFTAAGKAKKPAEALELAKQAMNDLRKSLGKESPEAMLIVEGVEALGDVLYKQMLTQYVPKIINRYNLTAKGKAILLTEMNDKIKEVEKIFNAANKQPYQQKAIAARKMVDELRALVLEQGKGFYKPTRRGARELAKGGTGRVVMPDRIAKNVASDLEYGRGFPAYVRGYFPRIAEHGAQAEEGWRKALVGESSFMKGRTQTEASQRINDLARLIEARISAQGKQLYFWDEMTEVVNHTKPLPLEWRKHVDFFLARATGRSGFADEAMAEMVGNTVRMMYKAVGRVPSKEWNTMRVARAAQNLTSLSHGGLLGWRPFAIMRNLSQPFLTAVPELGAKGPQLAMEGFVRSLSPKVRKYIRDIGGITDYVPEQRAVPMFPPMKFSKLGRAGDRYMQFKDAGQLGYRWADHRNRYHSGAMALSHFEGSLRKVLGLRPASKILDQPMELARMIRNLGDKEVKQLTDLMQTRRQFPWQRERFEGMLYRGKWRDARDYYVKEFIADTQYLYTRIDAPAMLGLSSSAKVITQFNSWWMNYSSQLSKWMQTGVLPDKIERMGTWYAASIAVESVMESVFKEGAGHRTAGFGPLPFDVRMPPWFVPAGELLQGAGEILSGNMSKPTGETEWDFVISRAASAARNTAVLTMSGGLQIKQSYDRYQDEGVQGALKALGNLK